VQDNISMQHWPDRRLLDLLNLEIPIIQAPMAGSDSVALARSVSSTGALGSLACALLSEDDVREAVRVLRDASPRPFNLNFFCHTMQPADPAATQRWKDFLKPHYERWGLDSDAVAPSRLRLPFDEEMCSVVEEVKPEVVSFHFGLPAAGLVDRIKRHGMGGGPRRRGCLRTWRVRRAVGHCLPALPRGQGICPVPPGASAGEGERDGFDKPV
jgi:nitronate monooxygenase